MADDEAKFIMSSTKTQKTTGEAAEQREEQIQQNQLLNRSQCMQSVRGDREAQGTAGNGERTTLRLARR